MENVLKREITQMCIRDRYRERLMELIGEVQSIVYYNEVNSYMIADFETEDELTTIVGLSLIHILLFVI